MLVREIDQQTGLSLAEGMISDKTAATALRADALDIALRCTKGKEADQLAVAHLADEQAELRRASLQFLSLGDSAFGPVPLLDGKLYLSVSNWSNEHSPIVVEPPQGLTAEMLKPLVENADEDTAALAQYQMILLGQHKYLKPVLEFWRRQHRQDNQWMRLAYRAIAVVNDIAELPTPARNLRQAAELRTQRVLLDDPYYGRPRAPQVPQGDPARTFGGRAIAGRWLCRPFACGIDTLRAPGTATMIDVFRGGLLASVLACSAGLSASMAAEPDRTAMVEVTGTATLRRPPDLLRLRIELTAKDTTMRGALEKLKDRGEAARLQLAKLARSKSRSILAIPASAPPAAPRRRWR